MKLSNCKTLLISQMANNQTVINTDEGMFFQSYNTLIAFKPSNGDTPVVTNDWDYSATTLKYLKQFLGLSGYTKKQIEKMIQSGSLIMQKSLN